MKNKIVFYFKIFIYALILLSLTSCWNSRELNTLPIVVGIGIDKEQTSKNVLLTAQILKPEEFKKNSSGSSGGQSKAYWNLKSSGETVFDALREFTHETSERLYTSHNQVIVIGKEIATEGIQKYLDFFMRAIETRPTTLILISSDTANAVLDTEPELGKMPAISISKLSKAQQLQSHSKEITFQDFTNYLLSKTTSPIAPIITVIEDDEKKSLKIEGMAVFKGDQMVGQLNESETRGLLWIKGEIKTGVINVPHKEGIVSIEIVNMKSKVTPKIINGEMYIYVNIKENSTLTEQTCTENLSTLTSFEELKKLQNEAIRNEILSALKKARELNTDIFGFGELIHKKYKKEWKDIESKWDDIFPSIQVKIEIESNLEATGHISKPAVPESLEREEN